MSKADGAFAGSVAEAFVLFPAPMPAVSELLDGQLEDTGGHHALDIPGRTAGIIGGQPQPPQPQSQAQPQQQGGGGWGTGAPLLQQVRRCV